MKLTALVASLAVLVMLAAPSTSHEFTGDTPSAPGNHVCSGTPDWKSRPGVSHTDLMILDQETAVYFHPPPHGSPDSQDPFPFLGVLWIESNGLEGFQKNDFVCKPTDTGEDAEPSPHADLVLL